MSLADGGDNTGISAAAADVATHPFANFTIGEFALMDALQVWCDEAGRATFGFVEQRDCGDDLAGCAVAALESIVVEERLLYGMQPALARNAFDGGNTLLVASNGEGQAAVDAASIQQYRACAALAMVAALLRAGKAQMFP